MLFRSFSRRIVKNLSAKAKDTLANELPQIKFSATLLAQKIEANPEQKIYLEIGIGNGEHFIHQAKINKEALFIGVEVYLNGIANTIMQAKQRTINNILLWPDDLDLMIQDLPSKNLAGIYILFPDPWPKRKQQKKRIFNELRFNIFKDKLKDGGFINFASDIKDYFTKVNDIILADQSFELKSQNFDFPHENYIATKYHQKAILENRKPQFLQVIYRT